MIGSGAGGLLKTTSGLIALFHPHCQDTQSLDRLLRIIDDRGLRRSAYDLFRGIRQKTLKADRTGDKRAQAQYLFEEACAKTLYNLTRPSAPFDPDAPFWIIPKALALAQVLDLDTNEVLASILI